MSRNLCRDSCDCGYVFKLGDFRGKPVEFRKYGPFVPQIGVKLECPLCHKFYFGWFDRDHTFWSHPEQALDSHLSFPDGLHPNRSVGRFVVPTVDFNGRKTLMQTGYYKIDLSYYESYNDEGDGTDVPDPRHLFKEDDDYETRCFQT